MVEINCRFVLASKSPRRKDLLQRFGFTFTVISTDVDETVADDLSPEDLVQQLALKKASSAAAPGSLTLGADTIVVFGDMVLGKPRTPEEAHRMLRSLSGATHTVYSGIALIHSDSDRRITAYEATDVMFADLSDEEISTYVASGSPMDKAGAYGIQDDAGAFLITGVNGDYYNVVGLPMRRLYLILKTHFADLLSLPN